MFMTEENHLKTIFLILLAKECQLHKELADKLIKTKTCRYRAGLTLKYS